MSENKNLELVEAINRNTAATRSIAIFLVGFIPWFLGGFLVIGIGAFVANNGEVFGVSIALIGVVILAIGAVRTIFRSLDELKLSQVAKD